MQKIWLTATDHIGHVTIAREREREREREVQLGINRFIFNEI